MTTPPAPARRRFGPGLIILIVALALLVVAGGWAVWEFAGTAAVAVGRAQQVTSEIRSRWHHAEASDSETTVPQPAANPSPGQALWVLRIPELWGSTEYPVMVGVGSAELEGTLGWYPGTSQPGQLGNFAVAGHCLRWGEPLRHLRDLPVGATVQVETADAVFTYEVISSASQLTVHQDESWVLDPIPGRADQAPTHALITLTTCEDLYPTSDRSVAFGVLTTTELK